MKGYIFLPETQEKSKPTFQGNVLKISSFLLRVRQELVARMTNSYTVITIKRKKMVFRKHLSAQNFRTIGTVLLLLSHFIGAGSSHVVIVDDQTSKSGSVIFKVGFEENSGNWKYGLDMDKSPVTSRNFLHIDTSDGTIRLRQPLPCLIWPIYIQAWNQIPSSVEGATYVSVPLLLINTRSSCHPVDVKRIHSIFEAPTVIVATVARKPNSPNIHLLNEICFSRSQLILPRLHQYVPRTMKDHCRTERWTTNHLAIEQNATDLVSPLKVCFGGSQYHANIRYQLDCSNTSTFRFRSETMDLILKHPKPIDNHHGQRHRFRREFSSSAPFYFDQPLYVTSVPEEQEKNLPVITLTIRNGNTSIPVLYSMVAILDARSQKMFQIDPHSGSVTTSARLDRESMEVHYLRVTAEDSSHPPQSATTTLQINVDDLNDFPPKFEQNSYETSVKESASIGSAVMTVRATDQDSGANAEVHYSIINPFGANEAFRIDPKSGMISTRLALDREIIDSYNLTIQAVDQGSVTDRKSSVTVLLIRISDENDNYPQFSEKTYTVEVPENISWADNPIIAHIR